MREIKINDNRPKNILIAIALGIVVILIVILIMKNIIDTRISKEIATTENIVSQEIEWMKEEYEGIVDIQDIIKENINEEIKIVIETQSVELEYETEYINNTKLPIGTVKVAHEGKDGKQELIIKKEYKGETLISDEQIGRKIVTPALNKTIEIGVGDYENIINDNNLNDIEYSNEVLINNLNKNMRLDKPSGLTLQQFKKIFKNEKKDKNNVFKENAEYFYYVEKEYGINGVFVAAIGVHESAWGTSKIAKDKQNLFGYGAYDMNAYASAYSYNGYAAGIDMIARVLMKNYLNPKGTIIYNGEIASGKYYNGKTLEAVNKRYATDKKWANSVYYWMQYLYNRL